jgi:hypothetical protein
MCSFSLFSDFLCDNLVLCLSAHFSTHPVNGPRFDGIVNGNVPDILCRAMAEMGAIRLDKDGNFVSADSDLAVKEVGPRGSKPLGGDFHREQIKYGSRHCHIRVDEVVSQK